MAHRLKIQGKLRLRARQRRTWLSSRVVVPEPQRYADAGFGVIEPAEWGTIESLLDQLFTDPQVGLKLTYARSPVQIEGSLPDVVVPRVWPPLVGAFEAAAPLDGTGELTLSDERQMARICVGDGAAVLESVPLAQAPREPVRVPGVIERARSGRSRCKACGEPIANDELRFGAQNLARSLPGRPNYTWYHLPCAARVLPHSLGPTLREHTEPFDGRDQLWDLLPEDAKSAERFQIFDKGTRVIVARESKGVELGLTGTVVWFGPNKYGKGYRVGLEPDDHDDVLWVDAASVDALSGARIV